MPGVQSFVAQRQQDQAKSSRQILGAQHRVPVPTTNLEDTKQKPSFPNPKHELPGGSLAAEPKPHSSRQQSTEAFAVQDAFDTDAEGFDDTGSMSIVGGSRGHQGGGDGRDQVSNRYGADAPNDYISAARVSFRRGQEPHHVPRSRQVEAEGSGEDDEGSYGESADEVGDEESNEEELVRGEILQDLNSPGFSQYLHEETSHTTQAAFQPVQATPVVHSSLSLRDVVQRSQKLLNPFSSKGNSANGGAANLSKKLQLANRQALERAVEQTPAERVQKVQESSIEHPSISVQLAAQHRKVSDHYQPSQQPSITHLQMLRRMSRARDGVAQDIVTASVQPPANDERLLSVQTRPIDFGDDDLSVGWDPNIDSRHDRKSTTPVGGPHTRKRNRDLDYSPDQLSSMTFQQLSNEPFNLASDTAPASSPQELSIGTLTAKIEDMLEDLKDDDTKIVRRRAFFSSLSIEQYEECASFMIRRFSDIMSKFTDARQQRRRAAKDFEEEVANREDCVRCKTTAVDKDLGRLKRGGEEVVRGAAL